MVYGNIWWWSLFHVLLGVVSFFFNWVLVIWFYVLILSFSFAPTDVQKKTIPIFLAWLVPFEILGRAIHIPPFIPMEVGKYMGVLLGLYGLFLSQNLKRGSAGKWILFLSLPSFVIGLADPVVGYEQLVSFGSGILALAVMVIYFANQVFTRAQVLQIFRVVILMSLSLFIVIYVDAPEISSQQFSLGTNRSFSGGLGNQGSTALSLAFGILIWLWLLKYRLYPVEWLNLALAGLFFIWALLTFSRGGVFTSVSVLIATVLLVPSSQKPLTPRKLNLPLVFVIFLLIVGGFFYVNELTGNQLVLRYQGKSAGTMVGMKEAGIYTLTSGRLGIFLLDVEVWLDHFLFGAGVALSPIYRLQKGMDHYAAAHVEVSRLLGEHGILGLIIIIILFISPLLLLRSAKGDLFRQALIVFCVAMALLTSMHAATRNFLVPFFFGLAFVQLPKISYGNSLHRK